MRLRSPRLQQKARHLGGGLSDWPEARSVPSKPPGWFDTFAGVNRAYSAARPLWTRRAL